MSEMFETVRAFAAKLYSAPQSARQLAAFRTNNVFHQMEWEERSCQTNLILQLL